MGAEIVNFTDGDLETQLGTMCFYSVGGGLVVANYVDGATYDPRSLRGQ